MRFIKNNGILSVFNNYLYDSLLPININYLYNTGSTLGVFLVVQILSGFFLAMFYIPNIDLAFSSIDYIMREVPYGWLIRYIHMNGATIFFFIVYLHMFRGLLYGSYTKSVTWLVGVIIFLLMIITAFLGYTLVWGQMSLWAATVITNLCSTIPLVGGSLVEWLWGGFSVGNPTLNRFYAFHYLLPFVITALVCVHLLALHDTGGTNPLTGGYNLSLINFHPYFTFKDIFGFVIVIWFMLLLVLISPDFFNHSDNYVEANFLVTPTHIVPEIYLLPYYAILRAIPSKTLGVLAMLASILILMTLPISNNHIITTSYFRPIYYIMTIMFVFIFLLLGWIGQAVVEVPYISIGAWLTFSYFLYFILLPVISFLEYIVYRLYN